MIIIFKNIDAKRLQKVLIILILCFQLSGCQSQIVRNFFQNKAKHPSNYDSRTDLEIEQDENARLVRQTLDEHRRLWSSKEISNYNFTAQIFQAGSGNVAEPVLIKVRGNNVISIEALNENEQRPIELYYRYETVNKMFDQMVEELQERKTELRTTYDQEFGFPRKIISKSKTASADGWTIIETINFEIVD